MRGQEFASAAISSCRSPVIRPHEGSGDYRSRIESRAMTRHPSPLGVRSTTALGVMCFFNRGYPSP